MVSQTVLPFKLETTRDTITAHAGLILFGEYLHAMGLPGHLDRELPGPLNPVGYKPSAYGVSLVLMLQGGWAVAGGLADAACRRGLADALEPDGAPE